MNRGRLTVAVVRRRDMAHRHPDLPDYCTICDPPRRSASEWFVLIVSGIVVALVCWALIGAAFVALVNA